MAILCKYCNQYFPETREHWYFLHGSPYFHKECYNKRYKGGGSKSSNAATIEGIRLVAAGIIVEVDMLDQIHEALLKTDEQMIVAQNIRNLREHINRLYKLIFEIS